MGILSWIVIGLLAGWLAGLVAKGQAMATSMILSSAQ